MEPFHILIVEDGVTRREALVNLCTKHALAITGRERHVSVKAAANQTEADAAVAAAPPRGFDLILLDRKYPKSDQDSKPDFLGDHWLPTLRTIQPLATIVVITGYAGDMHLEPAVQALLDDRADEYIPKEVDDDELLGRLIQALNRRQRLNRHKWLPSRSGLARISSEDVSVALLKARGRLSSLAISADVESIFEGLRQEIETILERINGVPGNSAKGMEELSVRDVIALQLPYFEDRLANGSIKLVSSDPVTIRTYLEELRSVMAEILQNAVNAIEHTAEQQSTTPITVTIEKREASGSVEVRVTDEGVGFDDRTMLTLFTPGMSYWTIRAEEHGGLGLYIAKRLMRGLGGDLTVANQSRGAEVTLRIKDWSIE